MIWRVAMARLDTVTNIKNVWTIDDLLDAHEVLDMKDRAEEDAMRKIKESRR